MFNLKKVAIVILLASVAAFAQQVGPAPGGSPDPLGLSALVINAFPMGNPPSGITFTLTGQPSITALPAGMFQGLGGLVTLDLGTNALTSLPSGIFSTNTALTTLSLYNNALTSLPSGIFSTNTALTYLDLNTNALTSLPSGTFSVLTVLTTLNVSINALDVASVDNVLADLVTAGASGGTVNTSGGANAPPDSAGLISEAALIASGWTVTTN